MAKDSVNPVAVSIADAADMLGVSRHRMYELVNKELIESRYEGARRLVSVASLHAYFASLPTTKPRRSA